MGGGRSAGNPNNGFHIPPWNRGGGAEQRPNLQGHSGKGGKAYAQAYDAQAYAQDQQEAQDFRAYKAAKARQQQQQQSTQQQPTQQPTQQHAAEVHWDDESHTQTNQQPNQQQQQPQHDWQRDTYKLSKGDVFGPGHN